MQADGRASFAERLVALRDQAGLSLAEVPTAAHVWEVADALPRAAAVPADPEDRERVALVARHPRRVDAATVCALAEVLAATRRLEDRIGSAAVLPGIRSNRALACSLRPMPAPRSGIGSARWPESCISTWGGCSSRPGTPSRPELNMTPVHVGAGSGLIQTCRADDNSGGTTFVTVAMGPWG